MNSQRVLITHALAGLAYGWLVQVIVWLVLLQTFHGRQTPEGHWIYWFDLFGNRVEPSIVVFLLVPIAFTVFPLVAAFWLARNLPIHRWRHPGAVILHSLIVLITALANAGFVLLADLKGYDSHSF
jgi:hypothetical protein